MRASSQNFAKSAKKDGNNVKRLLRKRLQIDILLVAQRHLKQKVVVRHLLDNNFE